MVATAPACIATRVRWMCSGEHYPGKPTSVARYTYRGKQVYYIPSGFDESGNHLVLDAECRTICRPYAGLTDRGDAKCPDFRTARSGGELIWKE
jgi:hypothetical protein